jgi:hypothetical protein
VRYYHSQNVHRHVRRKRRLAKSGVLLLLLLIGGLAFLFRDVFKEPEIDARESGEVRSVSKLDGYKLFEEDNFTLLLPNEWIKAPDSSATITKYQSRDKTHAQRQLDIYTEGSLPVGFDTIRALNVNSDQGKIYPGLLSERCYTFTKPKEGFGENLVSPSQPSVWQGANFSCNFSKILNYVTTVNTETGFITKISGPTRAGAYTFVYTDHTSRPDFSIFFNILRSFQHK